ncbi:hypothetical protein IFM89_038889 [Coptis chinensis]|uniref:Ubiquitin-like protease family profile domain-containing protein n=1 Tax=Coptis chinensis TaxID=261450 RepID=A0A835IZN5_9MAGN|nr:hypothetical protein IFM89_038889 [Coptis chinensis]
MTIIETEPLPKLEGNQILPKFEERQQHAVKDFFQYGEKGIGAKDDKTKKVVRVMKGKLIEAINYEHIQREGNVMAQLIKENKIATGDCPQQETASDCGLYICKLMEYVVKGKPNHFKEFTREDALWM